MKLREIAKTVWCIFCFILVYGVGAVVFTWVYIIDSNPITQFNFILYWIGATLFTIYVALGLKNS